MDIASKSCRLKKLCSCAHPEVLSEGSNSNNFLVDEEIDDPNTTKSRPSSARQRNANGGPMMVQH